MMSNPPIPNNSTLKEHLDKLKIITDFLPVGVYITDQSGVLKYFNERAVKLWGRRPDLNDPNENKYCGSYKIYDSDGNHLSHDQSPMARVIRQKESLRNEQITLVRPDYTRAVVLLVIDPIFGQSNQFMGAISVMYDVTDRIKTERDAYHLAAIVTSSDDAIISKTLDGEITSWNQGAEKVFGYKSDEVLGKNITILIPHERINEEILIMNKISNGEKFDHFETVRVRKDGREIFVSLTVSPIKNSAGKVIGASKIARDISEQITIKNKLEQYNQELQSLNNYKDEFISLASHELKTPLTVIKAHLELLSERFRGTDTFIDKTLYQANKLDYLINEMLDVSKMHNNKIQLNYEIISLDTLMKNAIENIKVINSRAQIKYHNEVPDLEIQADEHRLEQVIINLLNNAIKYSPGKNDIHLNVSKHENEVRVEVTDFGMGIPEDKFETIFKRFYRMEEFGKNISGLGIGLYISRQIIENHKGRIWVDKSVIGKGSTIAFTIPINPPSKIK